jgi:hypothetical protein
MFRGYGAVLLTKAHPMLGIFRLLAKSGTPPGQKWISSHQDFATGVNEALRGMATSGLLRAFWMVRQLDGSASQCVQDNPANTGGRAECKAEMVSSMTCGHKDSREDDHSRENLGDFTDAMHGQFS